MKKTERQYVELDLASIVSASENLRDTAPRLTSKGFTVFEATKEQPALLSLALSQEATEQGQFVALVEEHEPGIKELADNMATAGQLEPIRVRPAEARGQYDLVFGARRFLARLYVHAKSAGKIPARLTAEISEQDGKGALYASISENLREAPSPMDEARSYARLRKNFGMSAAEMGAAMGRSAKVIQVRLRLLRLPKELQEKVHLGKVGVERALKHLDGTDSPKEKTDHRMPTLREIRKLYTSVPDDLPDEMRPLITEEVRKLLAHWLGTTRRTAKSRRRSSPCGRKGTRLTTVGRVFFWAAKVEVAHRDKSHWGGEGRLDLLARAVVDAGVARGIASRPRNVCLPPPESTADRSRPIPFCSAVFLFKNRRASLLYRRRRNERERTRPPYRLLIHDPETDRTAIEAGQSQSV